MEKRIDGQKKKQIEKAAEECAAEIAKAMDLMAESMNSPDGKDLCVRTISIPIGEVDGRPRYVQVQVQARKSSGYESGVDREIVGSVQWWPQLAADARRGVFDEEVFCDMTSFAFDDLVKSAKEDAVSRRNAYLALAIKEFADVEAEIGEAFDAAQLIAKSLCTQACIGWQRVDGEISADKLVVFKGGERVLVDMAPVDMASLL